MRISQPVIESVKVPRVIVMVVFCIEIIVGVPSAVIFEGEGHSHNYMFKECDISLISESAFCY